MELKRLYFLRESKDLTQEEMGKIMGVNRTTISRWETTRSIIPLTKLNDYANYFNVSMDYIVGLSNIKELNISNKVLNKKIIGSRILSVRNQFNLSQTALSEELNTTHSTISAYETGKTLILTTFAYQICSDYNISLDWLCGRTE